MNPILDLLITDMMSEAEQEAWEDVIDDTIELIAANLKLIDARLRGLEDAMFGFRDKVH